MFASLRSNVNLFLLFKGRLTGVAEISLSGEEGVGTGEQLPPSKCVKKALISRQTLGLLNALDLTQTFE